MYPQQLDDDAGEDVVAFVAVAEPVTAPAHAGARLGAVPATKVAVATHLGSYESLGDTYRQLGRWVATHATPRPLDIRECYLVGSPAPEDELRTELHWPVH